MKGCLAARASLALLGVLAFGQLDTEPGDVVRVDASGTADSIPVHPLVLEDPELRGFRDDVPPPPPIDDPVLPRFFLNDRGHPGVDLDALELKRASTLRIELLDEDGDVEETLELSPFGLETAPGSSGRWITLDLNDLLVERAEYDALDLFGERDFRFRISVVGPMGTQTFESPATDFYLVLQWMRARAEWLAHELFDMTLERARLYDRERRKRRAWGTFLQGRDFLAAVTVTNASERPVQNERVTFFALYDRTRWPTAWDSLYAEPVTLGSGESSAHFLRLEIAGWDDARIAALRGLQIVTGRSATVLVKDEVMGPSSYRDLFEIDPLDPRRMAALLILEDVPDPSVVEMGLPPAAAVAAAETFIAREESGLTGTAEERWLRAQASARAWRAQIDEFDRLLELIDGAFADQDLGKLHDLMSRDSLRVHFGLPRETGPVITAVGAATAEYEVFQRFELSKPPSEVLGRGVIAAVTGAAGDLPVVADESFLRRRVDEQARWLFHHDGLKWQPSRHYVDAFLQLRAEDVEALASSLDRELPLQQVKGELMESLMARQFGRRWITENRARVPDAFYVNGWSIREYVLQPDGSLGGRGSKVNDGLVVTATGGQVVIHQIYEAKAGEAGVAGAPDQLLRHQARLLSSGLTIVSPTSEEIQFFQALGIVPQAKTIAGKERPVIHVPPGRITVAGGADPRVLVTAQDVTSSYANARNVSLRREQVERLSVELMTRAGAGEPAWNDPALTPRGYRVLYHRQVPPTRRISDAALLDHYLNGRRYNPDTDKWEPIYRGRLENNDPFMGENEFIDAYRRARRTRVTEEDIEKAREKYRQGQRFNRARGRWHTPEHLVHPHDPELTSEEAFQLWSRMTNPRTRRLSAEEARQKIANGEVWDWTAAGTNKWRKRDPALFPGGRRFVQNAGSSRLRSFFDTTRAAQASELRARRSQRARAGAEIVQAAADMIAQGLLEGRRVADQRLRVNVRRKTGSGHTFLFVQRGQVRPDGMTEYFPEDPPAVQKWLLEQWYRGGEGFFSDSGVPAWVVRAEPDGWELTWYGNPVSR